MPSVHTHTHTMMTTTDAVEISRLVYNPFVLKLLHTRLYYMDKLVVSHLAALCTERHDAMRQIVLTGYHVRAIMDDIVCANALRQRPGQIDIDVYLINFEYFLYRASHHYASECDQKAVSSSSSHHSVKPAEKFQCELVMLSFARLERQVPLVTELIQRHVRRTYFDVKDRRDTHRQRDRVRLFFNIKTMVETEVLRSVAREIDTVRYDKIAVACLHYIYMANEFMSDRARLFYKEKRRAMQLFNAQSVFMQGDDAAGDDDEDETAEYSSIREYIAGATNQLDESVLADDAHSVNPDSSSQQHTQTKPQGTPHLTQSQELLRRYASDFLFLTTLRNRLINTAVDTILAWGVVALHPSDPLPVDLKTHDEAYNDYTQQRAPSRDTLPYTDKWYTRFLGLDASAKNLPLFLPLVPQNEPFYIAAAYDILLMARLDERHAHSECGREPSTHYYTSENHETQKHYTDTTNCSLCRYNYMNAERHHFQWRCHRLRYHSSRCTPNASRNRLLLDHYIEHCTFPLMTTLQGDLCRVLYNVCLLLYSTPFIMSDRHEQADLRFDLFRMLDLNQTRDSLRREKFFKGLPRKLEDIIMYARHQPVMSSSSVRRQWVSYDTELTRSMESLDATIHANNRRMASLVRSSTGERTQTEKLAALVSLASTLTGSMVENRDDDVAASSDDEEVCLSRIPSPVRPVRKSHSTCNINHTATMVPRRDIMHETEQVRRLAYDMEILVFVVADIDRQTEHLKKYERSLTPVVQPETYVIHGRTRVFMKKIYIYYTRQLHALLREERI